MSRIKKLILSFAILLSTIPSVAFAQGNINNALNNLGRLGEKTGTTETDLGTVVGTAINAALTLVGIIFLILMVYAGYLWMTARGEETPIENAKKIIKAAIIGLVLVMSAYAITFFITSRFADPEICAPAQPSVPAATCSGLTELQCTQNPDCQLNQ